jgi:hypothetical protein
MKSLTKILLAATLLTSGSYTLSYANTLAKVSIRDDNKQDRHLSGFKGISVMGSFDVYIVQGNTESVVVEAPADAQSYVITEVSGGQLKVYNKHDSNHSWGSLFGDHKKVAVYVTVNEINDIDVTGSGNTTFKDGIHAESLTIHVTGSGDVLGKVDVKNLECSISGSGDMKLSGHAENSMIGVSGSGDYSGHDLATTNTSVHVSGSGDASVNANNSISASVSGSGDISYTGGAEHVSKSKSGSGDISGN